MPVSEGAKLNYFMDCVEDGSDKKRLAYLEGTTTNVQNWWLRSPYQSTRTLVVNSIGSLSGEACYNSYGVRPALILPYDAVVNEDFLLAA